MMTKKTSKSFSQKILEEYSGNKETATIMYNISQLLNHGLFPGGARKSLDACIGFADALHEQSNKRATELNNKYGFEKKENQDAKEENTKEKKQKDS